MQRTGFRTPQGLEVLFGLLAGGDGQIRAADAALSGVAVVAGTATVLKATTYGYLLAGQLNVTGAGALTSNPSVSSGTLSTQSQLINTTGVVPEIRSATGSTSASITSTSLATGNRAVLLWGAVRGSSTVDTTLNLQLTCSGTMSLLAGSAFFFWRLR